MAKTLIAGSDHAGLELKRELSGVAAELDYEVVDIGTHNSESTDYPDYAHQVASAVGRGEGLGLLVCGTGIGMSMAANRLFSASMTRQHNDANVLCIGARVVGTGLAAEILKAFLSATFEGGRHERRVKKIEPSNEG
jgi:ribose 5-phosphate isomerase B